MSNQVATTEKSAFEAAVIEFTRPMTGGQSWQWTKVLNVWLESESNSTNGLQAAVDAIAVEQGFRPSVEEAGT